MVGVCKSDCVPRRFRHSGVSLMWKAFVADKETACRGGAGLVGYASRETAENRSLLPSRNLN